MEPWISNFSLGVNLVKKMVVWIRLSWLSMEFWKKEMILSIALAFRKPIGMDGFTGNLQKLGFVRIKVEIDSMESLKSSISTRGSAMEFEQFFIYENVFIFIFIVVEWVT